MAPEMKRNFKARVGKSQGVVRNASHWMRAGKPFVPSLTGLADFVCARSHHFRGGLRNVVPPGLLGNSDRVERLWGLLVFGCGLLASFQQRGCASLSPYFMGGVSFKPAPFERHKGCGIRWHFTARSERAI